MKSDSFMRNGMAVVGLLSLASFTGHSAPADLKTPKTPTIAVSNSIPVSVFTVPTDLKHGHDPFFPGSTRTPGGSFGTVRPKSSQSDVVLILNGLSGDSAHRLAMINGKTVAEGEDVEIVTGLGRTKVRCIQIKAESVIVEVGGARRELHLRD